MMKCLFVGDTPSPKSKRPWDAFEPATKSGKTIREWAPLMGVDLFICINRTDSLFQFTVESAQIMKFPIISFGEKAHKALSKLKVPHFEMPHPSGRNRKINDKKFLTERLQECKMYVERCKRGYYGHIDSDPGLDMAGRP